MPHDIEVLISGAGPVGLSLAAQLESMGISFMIIERRLARSDKSKALVIWGRSLELLDLCMDAHQFLQIGKPVRKATLFDEGKPFASIDFEGTDGKFGTGVLLAQNRTEQLLEQHLLDRGQTIRRGIELVSFEQQADGVQCEISDQDGKCEQIHARYLAGCDGAHSLVRHTLDLSFPGRKQNQRWILADVKAEGNLPDSEVAAFWSRAGAIILFHFEKDTWRVVGEETLPDPDTKPVDPTLEEIQQMLNQRGAGDIKISNPTWLSDFRINERKVDQYGIGDAFLAGDAAHVHSPAGGQGMNTGIQDACNLAWKLAWSQRASLTNTLLGSYSLERSKVGDKVVETTSRATKMVTTESRGLQLLRNNLAKIALQFQWTQELARQNMAEFTVAYPDSPIAGNDRRQHHLGTKRGDRVHDLSWQTREGKSDTLYGNLAGGRAAVLSWNASNNLAEQLRSALDAKLQSSIVAIDLADKTHAKGSEQGTSDQESIGKLGLSTSGILVVRPDGYLAAAGSLQDTEILSEWIRIFS